MAQLRDPVTGYLAFTYRIYRELFGEAFGVVACVRRKMAELLTVDEEMCRANRDESAAVYLKVLEDREQEVFSMGVEGKAVPLKELNLSLLDRQNIFRVKAPSKREMENMALQSALSGLTGKR